MKYYIGKRCKGCRAICAIKDFVILAVERENCPCFECLVKVMCVRMCKERDGYMIQLNNQRRQRRGLN